MLKKLDRLIISLYIGPLIITTAVLVFLFLVQFLMAEMPQLVGKNIALLDYLNLVYYFSLNMVPTVLPLGVLLSSLITYGNLGEHNELTAMKGAGISLLRIIRPVLVFVVILAIVDFFYYNYYVPKANLQAYSLLWDIKSKKLAFNLNDGEFYQGIPNYSIKCESKSPDSKILYDVMIYDHTDYRGNIKVTLAKQGRMSFILDEQYLQLELKDGVNYSELAKAGTKTAEFMENRFEQGRFVFDMGSFAMQRTDQNLFTGNRQMKNMTELKAASDTMQRQFNYMLDSYEGNVWSFFIYSKKAKEDAKPNVYTPSFVSLVAKRDEALQGNSLTMVYSTALNQARNMKSFIDGFATTSFERARELNMLKVEQHRRYTSAVACLLLFLIGAPIGAIVKKGGLGVPVLISIIVFMVYYLMSVTGEKWSKEGVVPVVWGMWTPQLILMVFGFYFLQRARVDAAMFETSTYVEWVKKLFNRFRKAKTPTEAA